MSGGLPAITVQTLRALDAGHDDPADLARTCRCTLPAAYGRLYRARQAAYVRRVGGRYIVTPAGREALRRHQEALARKRRSRRVA